MDGRVCGEGKPYQFSTRDSDAVTRGGRSGVSLIRVANNEITNDASGQVRVLARAIRVELARADDANVRVHQLPLRSAPAAVWCNAL